MPSVYTLYIKVVSAVERSICNSVVKRCFADPAVSISITGSVIIFNRKQASIAFHYRPTIVLL